MFSKNPVFCLKRWKLWQAPTTIEFNIFCWNFAHVSYLPMSIKGCLGFFYVVWILSNLQKSKQTCFLHTCFSHFFNNSRSKQNENNFEHPFADIVKQKRCAKFQQKILNFVVVGARQSFQFFRHIVWFLGNNIALSKFRYWILYNLISITKL